MFIHYLIKTLKFLLSETIFEVSSKDVVYVVFRNLVLKLQKDPQDLSSKNFFSHFHHSQTRNQILYGSQEDKNTWVAQNFWSRLSMCFSSHFKLVSEGLTALCFTLS